MRQTYKQNIAQTFGDKAGSYDNYAHLQSHVAAKLVSFLSHKTELRDPLKILEIGCGTGLLTEHLIELYPDSACLITDLSEEMLAACQNKIASKAISRQGRLEFLCCDGEMLSPHLPSPHTNFDLIISSMAFQWFQNPIESLAHLTELLAADGQIWFASLGAENFPEWAKALDLCHLRKGMHIPIKLPGIFAEEKIDIDYKSARQFLITLKQIGADQPRHGYHPLSYAQIRKAMHMLEKVSAARVSWHIVYGMLQYNSSALRR